MSKIAWLLFAALSMCINSLILFDCSTVPYARPTFSLTCTCISNAYYFNRFIWKCLCAQGAYVTATGECILCSTIANALSKTAGSNTSCACATDYMWYLGKCIKRCGISPNSLGYVTSNGSCLCTAGYTWQDTYMQCSINCGQFTNAVNATPYDPNSCKCAANFNWNAGLKMCAPNCSAFPHTVQNVTQVNGMCQCTYGYAPLNLSACTSDCQFVCRIDCNSIQYATTSLVTYDGCNCQPGLVWDPTSVACLADCQNAKNSPKIRLLPLVCACFNGYQWNIATLSC